MHKKVAIASAVIIVGLVLGAGLTLSGFFLDKTIEPQAFVGLTYCGDSVDQGKLLIDKVEGYTNLFVLQSGLLQRDLKSVEALGDYAVSKRMFFLPYFGAFVPTTFSSWLENVKQKWGDHLLGIYYADEPGGKMLDSNVEYRDDATGDTITKTKYGDIVVEKPNGIIINYELSGNIILSEPPPAGSNVDVNDEEVFNPNGTIQVIRGAANGFSYGSYQELEAIRPFKNLNETAQRFLERDRSNIEFLKNYTKVFTSDYSLHYFDYKSGYDAVLGQIGWNSTYNQQIAFLRGAAHQQNKDWGIFITWKYQTSPYLDNGTEILKQMTDAYQCGAKYFIVFNYYDSANETYGSMQPEHFAAVEAFWKNVVNNPKMVQGSIIADSVMVLPNNYGWGARWDGDKVWGIFNSDETTKQMWTVIQSTLQEQGLKTDIIYNDANRELVDSYQHIYRLDNLST